MERKSCHYCDGSVFLVMSDMCWRCDSCPEEWSFEEEGFELKTSEVWAKERGDTILDPDGWDRKDFDFSFHVELISLDEYERRVSLSTVIAKVK